jgi:hypothetical protein
VQLSAALSQNGNHVIQLLVGPYEVVKIIQGKEPLKRMVP